MAKCQKRNLIFSGGEMLKSAVWGHSGRSQGLGLRGCRPNFHLGLWSHIDLSSLGASISSSSGHSGRGRSQLSTLENFQQVSVGDHDSYSHTMCQQ